MLAEDGVALNDSRQRLAAGVPKTRYLLAALTHAVPAAVDALRLLVEGAKAAGAPASESAELLAAEEALAAATA